MAGRQGGIHISYLIISMVINFALIGAVVVVQNDGADAKSSLSAKQKEIQQLESERSELKESQRELRRLIHGDTTEVDKIETERLIQEAGGQVAKDLGSPSASVYSSFYSMHNDFLRLIKDQALKIASLQKELDGAQVTIQQTEKQKRDQMQVADSSTKDLKDQIEKLQTQVEDINRKAREDVEELQNKLDQVNERSQAQIADLQNELYIKDSQILQLEDRINVFQREINKEKTFATVDPDGEVLEVSPEDGFAWVNLGRDKRLRRGLVFEAFQYLKGGRKLRKGRLEIVKVNEKYAQAKILATEDDLNPIVAGDKIASPFYDESAVPTFVFAGDKLNSRRISLEEVSRRIDDFGGKIEGKVTVETTYVVALNGYESSPEYNSARELGVTILSESELLDFIGLQ